MLNINEDWDEVFKKAAAEYQLNTNSGDFKKVLFKLQAAQNLNKKTSGNKSNNRRYLLLLLLLPIGLFYYEYNQPVKNGAKNRKNEEKVPSDTNNKLSIEDVVANADEKKFNSTGHVNQSGISNSRRFIYKSKTNSVNHQLDSRTAKARNENSFKEKPPSQNFKIEANGILPTTLPIQVEKDNIERNEIVTKDSNTQNLNYPSAEMSAKSIVTVGQNKISKPENQTKTNGFYGGVLGGVDISTIKYQLIEDVGFNAGIVAGYQLNKRLSAEVLVQVDKKQYYTTAKHFDNSKVRLPYFSAVKTIEGDCKMIEVGVNGKYNFVIAGKSKLFAVGGFSSFFMRSENYTYKYVATTTYYRNYSYKNKSKHLFAALNIGIGYEHSLNNKMVLRTEPYFKLPLTGVGIGKLPISSSGLNLGIVRKF